MRHFAQARRFALGLIPLLLLLLVGTNTRTAVAATTEILYQEDFSSISQPPNGWEEYQEGWYPTWPGNGDYNGAYLVDVWDYNYNTPSIATPRIDLSKYSQYGDTAFVEFDYVLEWNYYHEEYGILDKFYVVLRSGKSTKQVLNLTSKDYTWYNDSYDVMFEPPTNGKVWGHMRIGIPIEYRTGDLQVEFQGQAGDDGKYLWGLGNMAIDNVEINATHFDNLNITPVKLAFGEYAAGVTSPAMCVEVSNPNSTDFNLSNFTIGGAFPGDYTITSSAKSVPAGGKVSICVTFTPGGNGVRTASLSFNTDADNPATAVIQLSGEGVAPDMSVAATTLFRKTRTKLGECREEWFLVTNTGKQGSLLFKESSRIVGDYPGEYRLVRVPSLGIPPGASDTVRVSYCPTIEGSRPATLILETNAASGAKSVDLRGLGVLPRLVITPSVLNFDSTGTGDDNCRTLTLSNTGSDTLVITKNFLSIADPDFTLVGLAEGEIIAPEQSKSVQICFLPLQHGIRVARFRVLTNIPLTFETKRRDTSAFEVNISGAGVPYGRLSLGDIGVDSSVVEKEHCITDTIWNIGAADVTITGVEIVGANASEFSLTGLSVPFTVPANSFRVYTLCATPGAQGLRTATLHVTGMTNNKASVVDLPISIYGQGVCASLNTNTLFDQEKVLVNTPMARPVIVTNCGDVPTAYTAAFGTNFDGYSIVGATTSPVVPVGGTTEFMIEFKPIMRGPAPATLTISAEGAQSQVVTLSGIGAGATITGMGTAPETPVFATSNEFDVVLTNNGNIDWTPGVPTVSGPFTYVSGGTTAIAGGSTGTLRFTFTPTVVGTNSGSAVFPTAAPTEDPSFTLQLSGLGATSGVESANADGYVLEQNYPNPFNPSTAVRYTLPRTERVTLSVIDAKGETIAIVVNEVKEMGTHEAMVSAAALPSGTYFYQLEAGGVVLTKQMKLVK